MMEVSFEYPPGSGLGSALVRKFPSIGASVERGAVGIAGLGGGAEEAGGGGVIGGGIGIDAFASDLSSELAGLSGLSLVQTDDSSASASASASAPAPAPASVLASPPALSFAGHLASPTTPEPARGRDSDVLPESREFVKSKSLARKIRQRQRESTLANISPPAATAGAATAAGLMGGGMDPLSAPLLLRSCSSSGGGLLEPSGPGAMSTPLRLRSSSSGMVGGASADVPCTTTSHSSSASRVRSTGISDSDSSKSHNSMLSSVSCAANLERLGDGKGSADMGYAGASADAGAGAELVFSHSVLPKAAGASHGHGHGLKGGMGQRSPAAKARLIAITPPSHSAHHTTRSRGSSSSSSASTPVKLQHNQHNQHNQHQYNEQQYVLSTAAPAKDLTAAEEIDALVSQKLLEAKALNREGPSGATMHQFSLWSSPPTNATAPIAPIAPLMPHDLGGGGGGGSGSVLSAVSSSAAQSASSSSNSSSTYNSNNTSSSAATPLSAKKATKLRGPRAAREASHDTDGDAGADPGSGAGSGAGTGAGGKGKGKVLTPLRAVIAASPLLDGLHMHLPGSAGKGGGMGLGIGTGGKDTSPTADSFQLSGESKASPPEGEGEEPLPALRHSSSDDETHKNSKSSGVDGGDVDVDGGRRGLALQLRRKVGAQQLSESQDQNSAPAPGTVSASASAAASPGSSDLSAMEGAGTSSRRSSVNSKSSSGRSRGPSSDVAEEGRGDKGLGLGLGLGVGMGMGIGMGGVNGGDVCGSVGAGWASDEDVEEDEELQRIAARPLSSASDESEGFLDFSQSMPPPSLVPDAIALMSKSGPASFASPAQTQAQAEGLAEGQEDLPSAAPLRPTFSDRCHHIARLDGQQVEQARELSQLQLTLPLNSMTHREAEQNEQPPPNHGAATARAILHGPGPLSGHSPKPGHGSRHHALKSLHRDSPAPPALNPFSTAALRASHETRAMGAGAGLGAGMGLGVSAMAGEKLPTLGAVEHGGDAFGDEGAEANATLAPPLHPTLPNRDGVGEDEGGEGAGDFGKSGLTSTREDSASPALSEQSDVDLEEMGGVYTHAHTNPQEGSLSSGSPAQGRLQMGGEKEEGQRRPRELGQETQTLTQGQGPSLDLGLFPFVDSEEAGSPLRWKKGELIGEGTFGRVYKGMNERTGELLAIKQLYLSDGTSHEVESLRREIRVMWDLHHDNIVRYMGTSRSERYLFIILEYVTGGSIASMLGQFGPFSEKLLRRFTRHITSGVEYLHSKSIIHRDIKGANILVSDAGVAKLADFGCSKQLAGMFTGSIEESNRGIRGSVPWMAPEVVKQSGHGKASDVWSIGATVIEMATGKPPWPEFSNNLAALFHVATAKTPPPIPLTASPACAQLLSRCLVIDPAERASAFEMLTQCDFLTGESGFRVHSSHLPTPTPTLSAPTSVSASASASAGLADGAVSSHTGDVSISKQ